MKIRTSIIAKVLAWMLIAVSGLGLVGSCLLAVTMESAGFYEKTYKELRDNQFATYSDRYSARVLEYLYAKEDTNQEYFAEKNFRYGVVEADFVEDLERLDLNDPDIYIDSNFDFDKELSLEDLHVFHCTINENTSFVSKNPNSLGGYYRITNTSDNWKTDAIEKFVYDLGTGVIYAQVAESYYPVPNVMLYISTRDTGFAQELVFDSSNGTYKSVGNKYVDFSEQQYNAALELYIDVDVAQEEIYEFMVSLNGAAEEGGMTFLWLEGTPLGIQNWTSVQFSTEQQIYEATEVIVDTVGTVESIDAGNYGATVTDVELVCEALDTNAALENWDKEIRMSIVKYGDMILYVKPADMKSNSYFVLSCQENDFVYNTYQTLAGETDVFGQYDMIVGTLYSMRYQVLVVFFVCLAVYVIAFVFLCCTAGHRKNQTELVEAGINRVPLEVYAGVFLSVEAILLMLANQASYEIGSLGDGFWIAVVVMVVLCAGLLFTEAGIEFVTRIKLKTLWKRTICYWIISKLFGGCKQAVHFIVEHTGLVWKVILVLGVNAVADLIILWMALGGEPGAGVTFFVLKCVAMFILALGVSAQLKKLKEAGEHMAKGDLTYRVDTKGLLWDFKTHAENLNSVGEGLAIAVDERMKSERFKTELITNVSHDIKTPLTSIINYVDLIQKEEVNNEKIEEYLEVLERQSKRLKKLLEDLLEASKASAGTLQVGLETLEAGVFMVQTVGEFEEKTSAQDLELIIKKPDEPVYINADGRHFWRVIDNLMNNICKYAQPNTRVYINLEANEEEVYITFRNTSRYPLNISSEELMERFVRGDESRHTEGSGLGLSIAQSLMELMHGRFELIVDGDLFKVILVFARVCGDSETSVKS